MEVGANDCMFLLGVCKIPFDMLCTVVGFLIHSGRCLYYVLREENPGKTEEGGKALPPQKIGGESPLRIGGRSPPALWGGSGGSGGRQPPQ